MELREALSVLSKASSFSVATDASGGDDALRRFKDYLYIDQPIETDYVQAVQDLRPGQVLFLCGSSGDGKSEILTRSQSRFRPTVNFHLDATHSFSPKQTAVEALDQAFDHLRDDVSPLVVGINIGMLSNYAADGAERHAAIRTAMLAFLNRQEIPSASPYRFIDFEAYPKFRFQPDGSYKADFPLHIMRRLTEPRDENPFHGLFLEEQARGSSLVTVNFQLLGAEAVQNCIVRCLFKARLLYDQFLTARTLLDFLHHLLTREELLYNNLFTPGDNDLGQRVSAFDPARWHSRELDLFVVKRTLEMEDQDLQEFIQALQGQKMLLASSITAPKTLIRLFYVMQQDDIGNNYHHNFAKEFCGHDNLFELYAQFWAIHRAENSSPQKKDQLKDFYGKVFIPALQDHLNRKAFVLTGDQIHLATYNDIVVSSNTEILPDISAISKNVGNEFDRLTARISVNGEPLAVEVSIGLLELLLKIRSGYRPSRYDEKSLVTLEEVANRVRRVAQQSKVLTFQNLKTHARAEVKKVNDDYFSVR